MNAITNNGKAYVYILELHKNLGDQNVRDSIPELKICALENSEYINWAFIFENGFMPVVKYSPTILRTTAKEYYFTNEFWDCGCEFNWLHAEHYGCNECDSTVIDSMTRNNKILTPISKIWGSCAKESIELVATKSVLFSKNSKNPSILEGALTIWKHLKYFDFNWTKAFNVTNF